MSLFFGILHAKLYLCAEICKMNKLLVFLLALLSSLGAMAQGIVVIGQVLSAEDAQPLQSANVWFTDSKVGTTTNEEGFFMLRSDEPQKSITVSVVGYKKRKINLDYGKDQVVEVLLREELSILDEIVVMPNQNEAVELLTRVRENRKQTDPSNIVDITATRTQEVYANIANVKGTAFRRRLFADLESGAIAQTDTNYSLPVYALSQTDNIAIYADSVAAVSVDRKENAVEITNIDNWSQLTASYLPEVNPYSPYTTILNSNFLNPTARNARSFYHFLISDSTMTDSGKRYTISFRPKRDEGLLFRGTMQIDSATAAITNVNWRIPHYTPVNFLSNYSFTYNASPLDSIFLPHQKRQMIDLQLLSKWDSRSNSPGLMVMNRESYANTRLLSDTLSYRNLPFSADTLKIDSLQTFWAGIDSINKSRVQRLVSWAFDIYFNEYLHIWKIDVGPLMNLYRFNQLEGSTLKIGLRSGETFSKYFTFGGYYGYGFKGKQHKYGANIQWRFGPTKRNYLSYRYDHDAERYGYDDVLSYSENRVHDIDHLGSSLSQIHKIPTLAYRQRMTLGYAYEKPGFKAEITAKAENVLSNRFLPFIQNGAVVDKVSTLGLKANFRFSWKERTLDEYFHRIYLSSPYPVLRFAVETGGVAVGRQTRWYGKFDVYAHQSVPLGFGKLHWSAQATALVGAVPWTLLSIARGTRGSYYNDTDFGLIGQMELMSDMYIAANLRYQTRGYIFGYIPGLKKLGIREDLIFKIGYGHLRNEHSGVLALPAMVRPWNNMPYIEAGFGFSNILYLGDIELIWRVTHRDNPLGSNFGVRWCLSLDF